MKRLSGYLALPAMVGIALVMAAVLLLVTMTAGKSPTASAAACVVSVTKTASPTTTVAPGQTITYTLHVTSSDSGCTAPAAVTVTDTVPASTTYVASSAGGTVTGSQAGGTVTWGPSGTALPWTLTFQVTVNTSVANGTPIVDSSLGGTADTVPFTGTPVTLTVGTCDLTITKEANHDSLEWDGACWNDENRGNWNDWNDWDGNLGYDITVTNTGTACTNPVIQDDLETHGDVLGCDHASVVHVSTGAGVTCVVSACSDNLAEWSCTGTLVHNGTVELALDAGLENEWADHNWDDEDSIVNTACVANSRTQETANSDCATESVGIEHERHCERREPTATPTATPTAQPTVAPTPIVIIIQPLPTAAPLPTLAAPPTGTGSDSSSTSWALPIGLGLGGLCLIVLSGTALAKKRAR